MSYHQLRDQAKLAQLGSGSNLSTSYDDLRRLNKTGIYILPGQERKREESQLSTILLGAMLTSVISGISQGEAH
jgi:hypothetical protein